MAGADRLRQTATKHGSAFWLARPKLTMSWRRVGSTAGPNSTPYPRRTWCPRPVWLASRVSVSFRYRYQLRRGDEVVATGHISFEHQLEVGERVEIGGSAGLVHSAAPTLHDLELHLIVELLPQPDDG